MAWHISIHGHNTSFSCRLWCPRPISKFVYWWTLDFASAFLSPGVNIRAELVPTPRANARNAVGSGMIKIVNWAIQNTRIQLFIQIPPVFNTFLLGNKEKYKSLVDRARKGTEIDAQECLQFPPCLASLFELESTFHVIQSSLSNRRVTEEYRRLRLSLK